MDNTSEVDKPVSSLTLAEINTKESLLNKSSSILKDSASNEKYPSVKAVKDYLESHLANLSSNAGITNSQLANSTFTLGSTNASLGGTYTNVTGLSSVGSTSFVGALGGCIDRNDAANC